MSDKIQSVRGMHDILPVDSVRWQYLESVVREAMDGYGYAEIRTPLIEKTGLFSRGIGEATDIVEKEMYSFPDRKGESLTLRPENTAGCVRAALQHGLMTDGVANRIWYCGPMFRYERPQKGRTRQFHQVGAEVYGAAGAIVEAELILMSARIWQELGVADAVSLEINTLGTSEERAAYRSTLVAYFEANASSLDADSQRRLETNPLRILDSKNPDMQALNNGAPQLADSLGSESREHFEQLQELLSACGLTFSVNPRLVRGLDYYSQSVWEWTTTALGAQGAVCGGGRYDGLIDMLGGKSCPAVGWALGMERLIALIEAVVDAPATSSPHAYIVVSPELSPALGQQLAESLRSEIPGLRLVSNVVAGSMKAQFKRADKSGASLALVIGAEEQSAGVVTVKSLRERTAQQQLDRQQLKELLADLADGAT